MGHASLKASVEKDVNEYVTMNIAGQKFGLAVNKIRDILAKQKITPIPLAPHQVAGSLNLRGRIITAIDLRIVLDLPVKVQIQDAMNIVIEVHDDMYSLIVDGVGDVLNIATSKILTSQENLSEKWRQLAQGIYPLTEELLVILDVDKIFKDTAPSEDEEGV
ncbi:MAG: chemotaxis protein CheW [Alphaproteobacteria bacterium]|nr:chemotaxis protein CheW [Alphaproteobacteria bacterium]OJV15090.1 MAG: hypothetical protein BGO27_06600 [Alphaproteobacteria bacterium 33-17]